MNPIDPSWQPVAFKEWQLVVDALARGEQSIILRKGGIAEGKAGFQWTEDCFFLFPTRFHQQADQVKPAANGSARVLVPGSASESEIEFAVYVETISTGRLTDWEEVKELDPYHIWKEEVIRERFEWGDEPGISYAVVKPYVMEDPWILSERKGFGGCRSWIELPSEEAGGWQERLENAREVDPVCGFPESLC